MLIDHIGLAIIAMTPLFYKYKSIYPLLRNIGRVSFPIFAFLIVEGFIHTKNLKKYLIRLGVFALLSEIPFDLIFYNSFFYWKYQNVLFTFFIAVLMLYFIKKYTNSILARLIFIILACILSKLIYSDYSYIGILLIATFYLYHDRILAKFICSGIILLDSPYALFSFIPLYFYNGEKGKYNFKYLIYIFYPLHLLLLFLFRKYILL